MFDELKEMMNDKKKMYILISCLAAVLTVAIVLVAVLGGNGNETPVTGPETTGTAQTTDTAEQTEQTTAPDATTEATEESTTAPTTEDGGKKPVQNGGEGNGPIGPDDGKPVIGNGGDTGDGGNTGDSGNAGDAGDNTEEEEDKTPTVGVDTEEDEATEPSDESNMVIDFDDLLNAGKNKNEG